MYFDVGAEALIDKAQCVTCRNDLQHTELEGCRVLSASPPSYAPK